MFTIRLGVLREEQIIVGGIYWCHELRRLFLELLMGWMMAQKEHERNLLKQWVVDLLCLQKRKLEYIIMDIWLGVYKVVIKLIGFLCDLLGLLLAHCSRGTKGLGESGWSDGIGKLSVSCKFRVAGITIALLEKQLVSMVVFLFIFYLVILELRVF